MEPIFKFKRSVITNKKFTYKNYSEYSSRSQLLTSPISNDMRLVSFLNCDLTLLTLNNFKSLEYINCMYNQMKNINLDNCEKLIHLTCDPISNLDEYFYVDDLTIRILN